MQGLPQNFQIIDSDDQQRLLKRTIKALNLDDKQWPAKQAAWYINAKKDDGLRPQHIDTYDPTEKTQLQIYTAYQEACDRSGLVDFAEFTAARPRNYCVIIAMFANITNAASDISWSTSFKTPTKFSMPGCDYWRVSKIM